MSEPTEDYSSNPVFLRIAVVGLLIAIVVGVALPLLLATRKRGDPADKIAAEQRTVATGVFRGLSSPEDRMAEVERIVTEERTDALPILQVFARKKGDLEFRLACIRALGAIGGAREAHTLSIIAESHTESREIRLASIAALGDIGQPYPLSYLSAVLTKEDVPLRLAAVEALARRDSPEVVAMLAQVLDDGAKEVRVAAGDALAKRKNAEATEALIAALRSPYPDVRLVAIEGLGGRDGPQVVAAVARAASDKDSRVQAAAIRAVRGAGAGETESMLAGAGAKASVAARLEIVRAIRRAADVEQAASLLRLLNDLRPRRDDADLVASLRQEVYDALVAMGEEAIEPVLAAALDGECDSIAEQVATDLCRHAGQPTVELIVAGVLKWKLFPDPEELKLWVEVLGDLGDPAALPALNRALAQDIPGMKGIVEKARSKIEQKSGQSLPACVPDAGILFEEADLTQTAVPAAPPAFHLPEHPDSDGLPRDGVVRIVLARAARREPVPTAAEFDMEIEIRRKNGEWQTSFIGYAPGYNKRNHHGRIVGRSRLPSGDEQLKIEIFAIDDQYVWGGYGEYELSFPADRSQFEGQYRGHFNFDPRQGKLAGACWNVDWSKPDYPSFTSGEHPRLLCREFQFDALRQRARTDFGRQVLRVLRKKLADRKRLFQEPVNHVTTWVPGMQLAVGHGLLAHLFDDPAHGRRAAALLMERTTIGPYGGEHGERIPPAWIISPYGYDMACDFLSPEERAKANDFFGLFCEGKLFTPQIGCIGNLNARGVYQVPGLTALSLVGEKGPFRWNRPFTPPPAVVLAGEDNPGESNGVPVSDVQENKLFANWLFVGPFSDRDGQWPLDSLGKPEDLRARPGMTVATSDGDREFLPLPELCIRDTPRGGPKKQAIMLPDAAEGGIHYLYCELQLDRQHEGKIDWRHFLATDPARLWLDGREMTNGTFVVLEPGRHRVLVEMTGRVVSPCLLSGNARRAVAMRKRFEWEHAIWKAARQRQSESGVMSQMDHSLDMCRHTYRDHVRRLAEETRATGRYQRGSLMLAAALRTASGENLYIDTPSAFTAAPNACLPYLSAEELCFGMGMAPAELQPALADEFRRRYLPDKLDQLDCIQLTAALVNYPLHLQPSALPGADGRIIANREAFHVSFLAGGQGDVQCQVSLRDDKPRLVSPEVYVPRAGTLLLRGRGGDWITTGRAAGRTEYEAVVEVRDVPNTGPCRVLDFVSDKAAGTASVLLDTSPSYQPAEGQQIKARRRVTVDFTGRCGAEMLLVVRDQVRGKGKKTWTLPTGVKFVEYGDRVHTAKRVKDGQSRYVIESQPLDNKRPTGEFLLRQNTMAGQGSSFTVRGVILRPADCNVEFVPTATKASRPVLQVTADRDDVEFLVVLTLQQHTPPPVSWQTSESGGILSVGDQKLRITDDGLGVR